MIPPVPVSRRAVLGAAGLALPAAGLAACTGDRDEPARADGQVDTVRVNTGVGLFQGREAYLTVGEQLGFFREEGIEIEVVEGDGTETNLTQLVAGEVDVATIDIAAGLIEYDRGNFVDPPATPGGKPISQFVLTAVLHDNHLGCIMVKESSGITNTYQLEGGTMAAIQGGTNTVLFPAFADLADFDADAWELVYPPPPDFPALLQAGEVDAIQQFVVARNSIEFALGEPMVVFGYEEHLPEFYGSGLGCSRDLAERNPDLVRRFNRAALRSLAYAVGNPDEAGRIFAQHPRHEAGQPEQAAAAENLSLAAYVSIDGPQPLGSFDESRVARSIAILHQIAAITGDVLPTDVIAFDLYQ